MSSGPEIKLSLFRGICAGTRNSQRLKSYHVANPMWRDGERKEKEGIVVVEAHTPNHNLNSRTSTRQHPHGSPSPFYCPSPLFPCARTIAQRGASLQKQHKGEERRFLQGLILGSWKKKGRLRLSLSLSLFVPVQRPCFLMKMSRWMRALDVRSNPV